MADSRIDDPKILVGSVAIKEYFPDFRDSHDIDYLLRGVDKKYHVKLQDSETGKYYRIEAHGIPENIFDKFMEANPTKQFTYLPSLNQLYTLKVSHSAFDVHWNKTMHDILFFQRNVPNIQLDDTLYEQLYQFWLTVHRKHKHKVKLNVSNDRFFTDGVKRVYVHDDLHEAVKYNDLPMYQKLKDDTSKAMISEKLFRELPYDEQLQLCREETYVTALERFVIPTDFKMGPRQAYKAGAKKLVTSMTKVWFPKFIVENWKILNEPDKDYILDFKSALLRGNISKVQN